MNNGLEIRNKKLEKKAQKRSQIKDCQKNLCQFVEIQWEVIKRLNGKYQRVGSECGKGLQIENRVFLTNGHYKMVNSGSVRVLSRFDGIPDWATEDLISKYTNRNMNRSESL